MCDFIAGQLVITRPRGDGPAASAAARALTSVVVERYGGRRLAGLDQLLEETPPAAWESSMRPGGRRIRPEAAFRPFRVELVAIPTGVELSAAEEIRGEYFELAVTDARAVREIAHDRFQRLNVSPNWRLHPAVGVPDLVSNPFMLGGSHRAYLKLIGLDKAGPSEAQGIVVAVLDNGFANGFWQGAPSPIPVSAGQNLIPGDASTSGHGTLVAALVASSAPGADVVPIRMAGNESTEWDALHALARAVQLGAHVITFSYRQILGADNPCPACGMVRTAARSQTFATMVDWASDGRKRAIVAAAGNDGVGSIARPAAYPGAKAIAALNSSGTALWPNSNWDARNQLSVLALPGEDVAADMAGTSYSGTSFATAFSAALYAVGMGRYRTNDASVVSKMLTQSSSLRVSNAIVPFLQ